MSTSTWATQLLASNAVILDTETTGGAKTDQVIQLSILDMQGNVLFDSMLRPTCEINSFAAQVHGITSARLGSAPTLTAAADGIKAAMAGRTIIAYNASFDRRMMVQTFSAFNLDTAWLEHLDWQCAMRNYAQHLGVKNAPKLTGGDHSATGDCIATLDLLREMAGVNVVTAAPVAQATNAGWVREELDKATGYKDEQQRRAAALVLAYLDGAKLDTATVARALWTLGGPIQYAIEWGGVRG